MLQLLETDHTNPFTCWYSEACQISKMERFMKLGPIYNTSITTMYVRSNSSAVNL